MGKDDGTNAQKKKKDLLGNQFEPENKEEIELLEKLKKKKI